MKLNLDSLKSNTALGLVLRWGITINKFLAFKQSSPGWGVIRENDWWNTLHPRG